MPDAPVPPPRQPSLTAFGAAAQIVARIGEALAVAAPEAHVIAGGPVSSPGAPLEASSPRHPACWRDLSRTLGVAVQALTVLSLLALVAWPERHLLLFDYGILSDDAVHTMRFVGDPNDTDLILRLERDSSLSVLLPFLDR